MSRYLLLTWRRILPPIQLIAEIAPPRSRRKVFLERGAGIADPIGIGASQRPNGVVEKIGFGRARIQEAEFRPEYNPLASTHDAHPQFIVWEMGWIARRRWR